MKKALLSLAIFASLANADIFDKGKVNLGVSMGAGSSYGNTYTLLGVSANYFAVDNLSVGISYRGWFGSTPTQTEIALSANYYVPLNEKIHPYAGLFTRHTFISEYEDFQSYGARAGAAVTMSKNSYIGFGYAYEQYSNCVGDNECSTSYPEVVFALSF